MKNTADFLYGIKVCVYEGEHGLRISPSIATIKDISTQLEALHESVILVQIYLKRKDKKDKTR